MIMKFELNQQFLKEEIENLEKAYVQSAISLIKVPVFNKRIEEDMKATKDKNRIKSLEDAREQNITLAKGHQESIESLEEIITKAKTLLT